MSEPEVQKPVTQKTSRPKWHGVLRRVLFVVLLLLVLAGVALSGYLLHRRLSAASAQIGALEADLEAMQEALDEAQAELEDASDALEAQQEATAFNLSLMRAQAQAIKAQLSLMDEDIGQAKEELTALQTTLDDAMALARREDVETLTDMQERVESALEDATKKPFAAQQTLEVVWRDLDALIGAQLEGE